MGIYSKVELNRKYYRHIVFLTKVLTDMQVKVKVTLLTEIQLRVAIKTVNEINETHMYYNNMDYKINQQAKWLLFTVER